MSSNPFISSGGAFTNLNQLQIHCSPYEWWVSLRSGYTHSRGKFSYDIENFTKSLYLRRLVQGNSCFLAGFLTFMIRDVFILLELLTCAWKCEFPQAPVCFWWQVDSLLPKISTFMKTWDLEFWNILSRNVWALVWLISGSIVFSYIQSQHILHSRNTGLARSMSLGHSLGSSIKSVHERHRNSDGLQVKWSVFRAIWLKRQDP